MNTAKVSVVIVVPDSGGEVSINRDAINQILQMISVRSHVMLDVLLSIRRLVGPKHIRLIVDDVEFALLLND